MEDKDAELQLRELMSEAGGLLTRTRAATASLSASIQSKV